MLKEITIKEFQERFPEISTYGTHWCSEVFLEDGTILWHQDWNGEEYNDTDTGKRHRPVYEEVEDGNFEIIGYEEI